MAASPRTVNLTLLALLAGVALLVVMFLPAESPEPIQAVVPTQAQQEEPAELAEVETHAADSVDAEASERVEAMPAKSELPQASFGSFSIQVLDLDGSPAAGVLVRSSRGDPAMDWRHLMYSPGKSVETYTDAQGRAELPFPDPGPQAVLIGARKHRASAMERRERSEISSEEAWVLQLEAVPSMLVRLRDAAGQPVVGQTVSWWQDPTQLDRALMQIVSDQNGEANFDDLARLSRGAALLGTGFGVEGVFVERPLRIVQDFELNQGFIDLHVPETGSMRIRVGYEDGSPLGDSMSSAMCFRLGEEAHDEYFRWRRVDGQSVPIKDELALYEVVEIGQFWQFAVLPRYFGTPIATQFLGPRLAGERVELEFLLPPDPMARHRVRVLDPSGQPASKSKLRIEVSMSGKGSSSHFGRSGTTDEDGYLEFDLPSVTTPESWTLDLSLSEDGRAWRWQGSGIATTESHNLPSEVQLLEIPRIVSGLAVFADGSIPDGWVRYGLGVRASDSNEVRSHDSFMNVARKPGTFDLRASDFPSGQVVLSARLGEVTYWTDLDVALGQENVTIVLPHVGSFAVRAGENSRELFARLHHYLMLPNIDPSQSKERDVFSSQSVPRGDSFKASRLPIADGHSQTSPLEALAGPMQWAAKDSFHRIVFHEAFDLPAESTRENPHLRTLPQLPLQGFTLRVRTQSGEVLARAHSSFELPSGSREHILIQNGVTDFVAAQLPPPLKVRANGFVEQTVYWTGPELEVVLQPESE
jgi:hypothetical protein